MSKQKPWKQPDTMQVFTREQMDYTAMRDREMSTVAAPVTELSEVRQMFMKELRRVYGPPVPERSLKGIRGRAKTKHA